jgi:hypothetical protein
MQIAGANSRVEPDRCAAYFIPALARYVMFNITHEALYMVSWYECLYIKGRYTGYPCVILHMGLTPGYMCNGTAPRQISLLLWSTIYLRLQKVTSPRFTIFGFWFLGAGARAPIRTLGRRTCTSPRSPAHHLAGGPSCHYVPIVI